MHWTAPTEKNAAATSLENRLWAAADQFRANSGLKAQEYSGPILGLIFLRFVAEHHQNPAAELAICGVEKTDETGRAARQGN
jgi:type I restriction enzyme M protein